MSFSTWFMEAAHVNRVVNWAYLIVVAVFGISVFLLTLKLKNRNAARLYIMSIPIWLFIEGGSILAGIRVYEGGNVYGVLFVVSFMEDPAWVALAYIASERIFRIWGRPAVSGPDLSVHAGGKKTSVQAKSAPDKP